MASHLSTKLTLKAPKFFLRSLGLVFLLLAFANSKHVGAQAYFLPMNKISEMRLERAGIARQQGVHYGSKPTNMLQADISGIDGLDKDSTKYYYKFIEKVFSGHLIEVRKPNFNLNADPLFNFGYGKETLVEGADKSDMFFNTRGFAISGQIGEQVFFYTDFRENQARYPAYLDNFIDSLEVVPGSGRVKTFKEGGYDFSMASGYVGVNASDWLSLSFGHFKQFVGFGHRSLLVSDNAFNYPFASYTLRFFEDKLQYRYGLSLLQNLERLPIGDTPESIFKRKYMSSGYLSYKPLDGLEIGFYESLIWKGFDDSTGTVPLNAAALNPIPGLNSAICGLGESQKNGLLGINIGWQPIKPLLIYGQVMADDLENQKLGYQIGAKYFKILKCLDIKAEYNHVEPRSYSVESGLANYSHYNQPLAHPLGAGFEELVASVTYYRNRIYANVQFMHTQFSESGRSPLQNDGVDAISLSKNVTYLDYSLAYIFNPATNMQLYVGYTDRQEDVPSGIRKDQFWYFGFRTRLMDVYNDF